MYIKDIFGNGKTVFSIEVFPPKKSDNIDKIYDVLDRMAEIKPAYISVTYGAGGSEANDMTSRIARDIKTRLGIEPLPHLTCIHNSETQIEHYLAKLSAMGIENVLALRGDRRPDQPVSPDFTYASDLVAYIKRNGGFNIVGACYPIPHPEAPSREADIDNLKRKVDAGVTSLDSQLFFDNADFFTFRDIARAKGINVPIEAGIMPVTNRASIERVVAGCGVSLPAKFTRIMARYGDDPQAMMDAGIAYAIDQIVGLITEGVDGIHLYAMNKPEIALRIYDAVKNLL